MLHLASKALLLLPFVWFSVSEAHENHDNIDCDACIFWEHDRSDCKVYGQIHTGGLIAFHKADAFCLNHYNIHLESMPISKLEAVFPHPDGSGGNLPLFIDLLREDAESTSGPIHDAKLSMTQFFQADSDAFDPRVLFKDRIQLGVTEYDCTQNQQNNCWTALSEYFSETTQGQSEFVNAGQKLWRVVQIDKETEQKSARVAICADNSPAEEYCGELVEQIFEIWRGNSGKDCSIFGLGAAGLHISQVSCYQDEANRFDVSGAQVATKAMEVMMTTIFLTLTLAGIGWS